LTDHGPRLVDARARLLADADMRATPDDAVLLPDDASSTWTTRNSPDDGTPDNGLFVVRPNPDAPGEWRIVGRLDGDPEPDEGLTMRSTAWTVTCGSVPSDACPLVAAAFERSADGHDGEVASRFSVAPRDTCPADAPAGMRCWQVSIGADGVSDCTVIGLLGASAGAGYGWTSRWTADRAGEGTPRGSDDPESTCE
jgi:hypothetical protein